MQSNEQSSKLMLIDANLWLLRETSLDNHFNKAVNTPLKVSMNASCRLFGNFLTKKYSNNLINIRRMRYVIFVNWKLNQIYHSILTIIDSSWKAFVSTKRLKISSDIKHYELMQYLLYYFGNKDSDMVHKKKCCKNILR